MTTDTSPTRRRAILIAQPGINDITGRAKQAGGPARHLERLMPGLSRFEESASPVPNHGSAPLGSGDTTLHMQHSQIP